MQLEEQALGFPCQGEWLTAILSPAAQPARRGVLIVVGGPQYRAGSHRQFTLLARALAAQGVPAMRFDYRGMGDSSGAARDFEEVDADLRAAIDQFMAACPGLQEVVLWGLCDAASAAMFYARQDDRVCGMVLLNPWARSTEGLAKATLKHYYRDRLLQPELWRKIFSGRFRFGAALRSFAGLLGAAYARRPAAATTDDAAGHAVEQTGSPTPDAPGLHQRMLEGLQGFSGKVLFIFSGADLTAQEFLDMVKASRQWQGLLAAPRVTRQTLAPADHTFSRREWRDQVAGWTSDWVRSW
ncbi:hydrolase 1, exosortase A system-associated [Pseudoduganella violacea]|uniref:Exosortase A-associated hydrolase 1 n=1 Tax=Pseudoduganella violacea TaxID=1715466 RepID=A0A7W5B6K1_9BURK|nr:hydrolase 1, exosortase A system-associated [Pseudoduganella violacea]MBB3117085.1 exosortase A-associated hydrolase 1 [Pseudoduganella violacea]